VSRRTIHDEPGHGGLEDIEVPTLQPAAQLATTR
jgi:hypothetical protein